MFPCYPSGSSLSLSVKRFPTSLISTFPLDHHEEHELYASLCLLPFLLLCLLPLTLLEASSIFSSVRDPPVWILRVICSHTSFLYWWLSFQRSPDPFCQTLPALGLEALLIIIFFNWLRGNSNLFVRFIRNLCNRKKLHFYYIWFICCVHWERC